MVEIGHNILPASLGNSSKITSFHFGSTNSSRKVYIQAALHADEIPGMLVAWQLKQQLQRLEAEGHLQAEVVLVPQANPLGHAQTLLGQQLGRFSLASGENFNRSYSRLAARAYAQVKSALGSCEAENTRLIRKALLQAIAAEVPQTELQSLRWHLMRLAVDADVVLDLHCDYSAVLHVYTAERLWAQCAPLASLLGSQVNFVSDAAGGDPFDEACCKPWWEIRDMAASDGLDVPIALACLGVTIELRGQQDVSASLARQDADAILDFLRLRGYLTDRPVEVSAAELATPTPLAGSENIIAPHPGIVHFLTTPGSRLQPGEPLAEIIDPVSNRVSVLSSRYGGVVYTLENRHYATTGMWVAKVATGQAFKTGNLLSA